MDVKVDVSNILPGDHESLNNAGIWLREHLNIPHQLTIFEQFEEYFNCKVVREPPHDLVHGRIYAVFDSEQDAAWFIMKWS